MTGQIMRSGAGADRARSALAVVLLHALLGYALMKGFAIATAPGEEARLSVFDVALPVPPPPEPLLPEARATPEPEGAAAPPNLKARPAPVVAPPPLVRIEPPTPLVAAPVAGAGPDSLAGAADRPGPGTGAGGVGDGTGSGRAGSGAGGGGGIAVRAQWASGRIAESDLPRAAWRSRSGGSVTVRLAITPEGRVGGCGVMRTSGDAALDALTCRLIRERFRYTPARDRQGRAVADETGWRQDWWLGER